MSFDPQPYMLKLQGKSYLPVQARVAWFREECPAPEGWGILTERVAGGYEAGFATYRATILDPGGRTLATATKTEDKAGFKDYEEKAETGAIGRALGLCGFGTLFALELEEGTERIADSPIERTQPPQKARVGNGASHDKPPASESHPSATTPPKLAREQIAAKYAEWLEKAASLGAMHTCGDVFLRLARVDVLRSEPEPLKAHCAELKALVERLEKDHAEYAEARLDMEMDAAAEADAGPFAQEAKA